MPIACDYCGKIADAKGKPEGVHWFKWMMDESREDDAVVALPTDDGEIGVICKPCLKNTLDEWHDSRTDETPNVEVTGAARLYRAASSDRRERGRAQG